MAENLNHNATFTKKRAAKFSENEIEALIQGIEKRKKVLFGQFGGEITPQRRDAAWQSIAHEINSVAPEYRSVKNIQKFWYNHKGKIKEKAATFSREAKSTGGGNNKLTPLTTREESVVSIIGQSSIVGIPGGLDTFQKISSEIQPTTDSVECTQQVGTDQSTSQSTPCAFTKLPELAEKIVQVPTTTKTTSAGLMDVQKNILLQLQQLNKTQSELLAVEEQKLAVGLYCNGLKVVESDGDYFAIPVDTILQEE